MKKHFFAFLALFTFLLGVTSVFAVYHDYYGNTYSSSKDFFQNYIKNNNPTWTTKSMLHLASVPADTKKEQNTMQDSISAEALKDAQRTIARTSRALSGTIVQLRSSFEYPWNCPAGWEKVDKSTNKILGNAFSQDVTTTCYTPRTCATLRMESIVGEPKSCPFGWDEAGLYPELLKTKSGVQKIKTRTCYQCQ